MLSEDAVRPGAVVRNTKTRDLYVVEGFCRDSEDGGKLRVLYRRVGTNPEESAKPPWSRPLALFLEKFEHR